MRRAPILFSLLLLPVSGLLAQDIEKEAQKPSREEQLQKRAETLAEEAAQREAPGEEASWEDVLAHPDDIQLNYRYARAQVRRGDVKGAAATLERILMVAPGQNEIRLFYAVVLYRLDDLVEARRELETLKGLPLPDALRREAEKYLKAVESRLKRTHLSGGLSLGFEYDTNRNASPASGRRLFGDTPLTLTGTSKRRDDTSILGIADVSVRRDLPFQAVPEVFGSFSYYQAEQTLAKDLNLKAYSLRTGGVWRAGRARITPALLFDHVQLAQSTFLRNRGAEARLDWRFTARTNLFLQLRDVYQDYVPTRDIPSADERTGMQLDLAAGSEHLLGTRMKFGTVFGYTLKHARKRYDAFDRWVAGINHSLLLGRGAFLLTSFTTNYDLYDRADVAISRGYRRDTTMRLDAVLGAPLSIIHPRLKDLLWTFDYEYYQALSSVENYAYTNNKIAAMLSYRWEAGL
ncbi:MAG: tetratricopeptide repeat protein [Elusimicrobia bacterium]|nr:tetratricopeptide repeat protein [Elusimicrobiota bacterium]